jgi:thiamine biosynthesis lipoprotein
MNIRQSCSWIIPGTRFLLLNMVGFAMVVFVVLCLATCGPPPHLPPSPSPQVYQGRAMGTTWSVVVVSGASDMELQTEIAVLIEAIEEVLSHWRDGSDVSRFNRASAMTVVSVSRETSELVLYGEKIRRSSGGAFDIRVARNVAARGFGPEVLDQEGEAKSGVSEIRVQSDPSTLMKSEEGTAIDLSAYVKGYAVDRIGNLLDKKGITNYLIEVGGELKARGVNKEGKSWVVGVEVPQPHTSSLHLGVRLENEAIATSGNYRLFHKNPKGEIESHIIDPREPGSSGRVFRSVSVIHQEAKAADAWATALFVLGETEGLRLAEELGLPVCFLRLASSGEVVRHTAGYFDKRLVP